MFHYKKQVTYCVGHTFLTFRTLSCWLISQVINRASRQYITYQDFVAITKMDCHVGWKVKMRAFDSQLVKRRGINLWIGSWLLWYFLIEKILLLFQVIFGLYDTMKLSVSNNQDLKSLGYLATKGYFFVERLIFPSSYHRFILNIGNYQQWL